MLALAAKADFLIENFRPGTLEKWNLEQLQAANPRLIMIRVSGYGQTGPYAGRAGFGAIGEAMGGLRYVVGDPVRRSRVGISIGDSLARPSPASARSRRSTSANVRPRPGRRLRDLRAVLGMMESLIEFDQTGYIRERTGAILPNVAPSNVYPARDGLVLIAANQDTVFRRLCEAMEQPALADDARYDSHQSRGAHQQELDELIGAVDREAVDTREVLALMEQHGVPAGQIYRAPEMLADPHFAAREAIVGVPHPQFGKLRMQNVVPKLSATPGQHPLAVARARRAQRRDLPRTARHPARPLREA